MTWTNHVPVLSTAHIPGPEALHDGRLTMDLAPYEEGVFLRLMQDDMPEWLEPVAAWMQREYPGEYWVRFDSDGDLIDGLPVYVW